MRPDHSHLEVLTRDGIRLSVERLKPAGRPARGTVVLQHGLGANRIAFLCEGTSLAEYLAGLGYDCFVPELRGAGRSQAPSSGWTLDDYLEYDLPAIIAAVQHSSRMPNMHWLGHSMGGVLMFMYAIEHGDAPISSLIALGSGLDYRVGPSIYQRLLRLRPWLRGLEVLQMGLLSRCAASVAGVGPALLPEAINFHRPNTARSVCRRIMAAGFSPIPMRLFDSLATTFDEHGFSRSDGQIVYLPRARDFALPALLLSGSKDVQCPPATAKATYDLIGSRRKELRLFGTPYGQSLDYGHFDLLVGRRANIEVWPAISSFLSGEQTAHEGIHGPLWA